MKRKLLILCLLFIGTQIHVFSQDLEAIRQELNKASENSTFLKDFKYNLNPGEYQKLSIILSKNANYHFFIYNEDKKTVEFKLVDKEKEILPTKITLKHKNILDLEYKLKESGIYTIIINNKTDKNRKSIILLTMDGDDNLTKTLSSADVKEVTNENADCEEIVIINSSNENSQNKQNEITEDEIFIIVEQMPRFGNTDDDKESGKLFREFIAKQIVYPEEAKAKNIQGRVYITFVIGKDGYIKNAKIARGVHPALDQEALRVVYSSPKWMAGMQRGQNVNVSYTIPITFDLKKDKKGE
ncbi:MAG: energy transducer TonB [Bacteroidales bacterium]|jgi:TonB family protein|nr:energy transducer TonB [Bacteroidales bacterium]